MSRLGSARPRRVTAMVALSLSLVVTAAWSNSGGRAGYSGKNGTTCNSCHSGGVTPTVTLTGPDRLDAGTRALYTFSIQTAAAITGMNAAASDGVVLEGDAASATQTDFDEVVHARMAIPDAGEAIYAFSLIAPAYGGKVTLFAAGNACDDDGQTNGDRAAATSLEITVDGPARPPPDASPPPPPPPPPPPIDAGDDTDAGTTLAPPSDDTSSCALAWPERPLSATFAALMSAITAAAFARRHRRRR